MAPKATRKMARLEDDRDDPSDSEENVSTPPKRRGRPRLHAREEALPLRSQPNNKVAPKPSKKMARLEDDFNDPSDFEEEFAPEPKRRCRPRSHRREETRSPHPQPRANKSSKSDHAKPKRSVHGKPDAMIVVNNNKSLMSDGDDNAGESSKATKKARGQAKKAPQSRRSKSPVQEISSNNTDSSDPDELPSNMFSSKTSSKSLKATGKGKGKATSSDEDAFKSGDDKESSENSSEDSLSRTKKDKGKGVVPPSDDEMPDPSDDQDSEKSMISVEWTDEDEILLQCTYDYELSLWRKTKAIFNCTPFDLFPEGIKAASDHWDGYRYENQFIKNETSLTIPLCKSLCTLVCFPYIDGDIGFVKYALSFALKARCGDNTPMIEEGTSFWTSFESQCEGLFNDMNEAELFLSKPQLETLKRLLSSRTSLLEPSRNSGFLKPNLFKRVLASTRTAKESGDSIHLLNGDVQNVIKAWDMWNKDARKYLPSMEDSRRSWHKANNKAMKVPRATVLQWKKSWILKQRLDAAKELAERAASDDQSIVNNDDNEFGFTGDGDNGFKFSGDDNTGFIFDGDNDNENGVSCKDYLGKSHMDSPPRQNSNDAEIGGLELDDLPLEDILTPRPAFLIPEAQDPRQPNFVLSKETANSEASVTAPTTHRVDNAPTIPIGEANPATQSTQVASTTPADKVKEEDIMNYLPSNILKSLAYSEDIILMENFKASYPPSKIPDVLYQNGDLEEDFEPHGVGFSIDVSNHIKSSTIIQDEGATGVDLLDCVLEDFDRGSRFRKS
ncbi:hypothetical protein BGAL_0571g00040 [Botrytis galanthina]|uniref:Uncharacterized protein n=1 Tax=Botrytis galanthina TaxID=278940 RepID=A0A4S8QJU9_9HELO|nr:hypothetical protein BGAL_0571g00040 [Botrytis galanthina]